MSLQRNSSVEQPFAAESRTLSLRLTTSVLRHISLEKKKPPFWGGLKSRSFVKAYFPFIPWLLPTPVTKSQPVVALKVPAVPETMSRKSVALDMLL